MCKCVTIVCHNYCRCEYIYLYSCPRKQNKLCAVVKCMRKRALHRSKCYIQLPWVTATAHKRGQRSWYCTIRTNRYNCMVFSFLKMLACDVLVRGQSGVIPRFLQCLFGSRAMYIRPLFGAEHIANRSQSVLLGAPSYN